MPFPSNDEYIDASFLPSVSPMIYSTPEFVAFRSNDRSLDGHATNAISFSEVNTKSKSVEVNGANAWEREKDERNKRKVERAGMVGK